MEEMFDSAVRSAGDIAGVFEFDGDTSYFYLYQIDDSHGNKILDAIRISSRELTFSVADISIEWDVDEQLVGLLIKGVVWAVFDSKSGAKLGGDYQVGVQPKIPQDVALKLASRK